MGRPRTLPTAIYLIIMALGAGLAYLAYTPYNLFAPGWILAGAFVLASLASASVKVADQWERAVVLRLGRYRGLFGPGLFFLIPILETVAYWIDVRVITSAFKAEKTLTKDTVPVRELFPRRICLRVTAKSHVAMVLGDQAYERGAWANRIPESDAGTGYVWGEGIREPLRVRAGWVPDETVKALEAFVTGGAVVPLRSGPAAIEGGAAA